MNGVMDEIMIVCQYMSHIVTNEILIDQLADAFLGTAQSTFSYMINAQAVLIPHDVEHVLNGCTRAQTSQAGLVYSIL